MTGCENLGAVAMPAHSWKMNGAWISEIDALKNLSNVGLNISKACTIAFHDHVDRREERPTGYTMRLVTALHPPKDRVLGPHGTFNNIPAARRPCTEFAVPIPTKDMLQPENVLDAVIPTTTNAETHLNAAEKWHQLGKDACGKLSPRSHRNDPLTLES